LTELLDLPPLTTERTLCKLVTDKTIYARIDRPKGVVTFKPQTNSTDILNSWTADIDKMLGLVEKTSHLVSKVSSDNPFLRVFELTMQEYAMHEAIKGKKVKA
jgi:26S proteasome regulatory subunit N5